MALKIRKKTLNIYLTQADSFLLLSVDLKKIQHITYRRFGFRVNDYFLTPTGDANFAINYYIQCGENAEGQLHEFHTLLIDLSQEQEAIWQSIQSPTRSEVKSFLNNQTFEHTLKTDLTKGELMEFITRFDEFANHKTIRKAERQRLMAYHKNGILALSYITQNGAIICMNLYRLTEARATNLHSFHLRHQLKDLYSQSHFGRAHRALHWLDIVGFKSAGVGHYDFCGWYNGNADAVLLNINKFKEQFTQHKVKEYSGVIYKNKLLLFLKNLR